MTLKRTLAASTIVFVAVGGTIAVGAVSTGTAQAAELPAFDSCTSLQHWVKKATAAETRLYGNGADLATGAVGGGTSGSSGVMGLAAPQDLPHPTAHVPEASSQKAADAVGSSATGTNVQEVGVDEPDQVKTVAGHYLVGISYERGLWVATVTNHHPRVIGRLKVAGNATQLLVSGQRALVLSTAEGGAYPVEGPAVDIAGGPNRPVDASKSRLTVVELSDPQHPFVVASEEVTGSVLDARQVGDVAWVVTQSQPSPKALLPGRTVRGKDGAVVSSGNAVSCTAVRHPIALSGSQLLTVQPVTIGAGKPFTSGRSAGVVASSEFVYASAKRLYVATNAWNSQASTRIHAFDISNAKAAHYVGSGTVRGTLLSQWAMSEQDGYLRVATTTGDVVPPPGEGDAPTRSNLSQTSVVVFAERGTRLVQVGIVSGLGRGERVWAVRYLGNVAAVVTFRQTDPLYLVDLSDPRNPKVRGALELTGYSSYLHPVGNSLLLGIGHEADQVGHVLNAKATLFDISDLAHPRKVSNVDLGNNWTTVDGDTHAFTYLPDRHVALVPTQQSTALAIKVDGTTLHVSGHLRGGDYVQRFVPVADEVVGMSDAVLLDVDPVTLDVLGRLPMGY